MELWIGALNLGFLYAFMTMGVFFTFRIHDFPDITVDGSFTSGAAIAAVLLITGWNPALALGAAFLVSAVAGAITAYIHTRFNVNGLLAGILVMTGLYSINLHIMGRSNIPLLNQTTVFTWLEKLNPGMHAEVWTCIVLSALMAVFWLTITLFLKTDLGIAMRATGNNPVMASANGVNVGWMTIFGVAFANGMVGVSGGLVAQYQGFADIGMGIGTVVIGLAAVIIGESVFRFNSIGAKVCSVVIGSVIFRMIIAIALYVGMNPIDLKLLTAVFVFLTLVVSKYMAGRKLIDFSKITAAVKNMPLQTAGGIFISFIIVCGAVYGVKLGFEKPAMQKPVIGIVQFALEPNVELCKQGIVKALAENGFTDGENIEIIYGNANADFSTINAIIQDFLRRKVSIITPLSTPCVQSSVQFAGASTSTKVVFTYIFDPYRIGAAKTAADHPPNMTGVACFPPIVQMLDLIKELLPGKKKIGVVWNSSEANSESVLLKLREHARVTGHEIIEATVTGPAEVLEASRSLTGKGAQVFLNGGDNTLNVGYNSFQKVAGEARIPVFSVDSEFIEKGALAVLGPDYYQTGYEGGEYLARVLKGEDTAQLPILQTQKTRFIFSPDAAAALGITVPPEPLKKAEIWRKDKQGALQNKPKVAVVLFSPDPSVETCKRGVLKALADAGFADGKNMELVFKNAQADFSLITPIMQDLLRRQVDIIIPLSTPCLQSAVQVAGKQNKTKIVFAFVYNPFIVGVGASATDHLPTVTGYSSSHDMAGMLDLMKRMFPGKTKIGIVWNSSEINSEVALKIIRQEAALRGLEIIEAAVTGPHEVLEAARSVVLKGAHMLLSTGDNTVCLAFDSMVKVAGAHKLPLFSIDGELLEKGALAVYGTDFYQNGYDGGAYAARVLKGEKPAGMPIVNTDKNVAGVNMDTARKLGFTISDDMKKHFTRVIDSTKASAGPAENEKKRLALPESVNEQAANRPQAEKSSAAAPKRVALFRFSDNAQLLEIQGGFFEYLEQQGAIKKYNLTIDTKNAQNEFSTAQSILQDIVRRKYDYLVTISTLALQIAAQVNKTIPHVFGGVTDPYRMGVAKNSKEHLPQLTGVASLQPVESLFRAMREVFPNARRVGFVWNPGEACSEACTLKARVAAKEFGFELVEATVSSTSEVIDALRAVINKKIDIFVTMGDNTVILALDMVSAALHQARIPYCTNAPADVDRGALLSVGADYVEVGRETAKMAMRVFAGENPKDIPINNFVPEQTVVNRARAREYGITLPGGVLQRAAFIKD